jgi:hypothetical protein
MAVQMAQLTGQHLLRLLLIKAVAVVVVLLVLGHQAVLVEAV